MVTTASIFIAAMFLGTCVRKDILMDPSSRYALNFVSEPNLTIMPQYNKGAGNFALYLSTGEHYISE